jgi:hypothetical protein
VWRRGRGAAGTDVGAGAIGADISAQDISGQIAVGSNNMQISAAHGAIVTVNAPGQAPSVHARPLPVALQPRDFPELLGRDPELGEALGAVAAGETVALVAPAGTGKTSLLRRLSHAGEQALEHGVVFLRAAGQPRADVERFLFDAFYEADAPYQPTPTELRQRLAGRRALVVLDDLDQERDDVCELLDCAPGCRFLLASERRALWGEGRTLELRGLDHDAALALLERELGRPLREDERARAADLCARVDGRPLSILQAAALARGGELPLGATGELEAQVRDGFDDAERRVLLALELLAPAAVHVEDVAAIAGVPDAAAVLERLRAAGAAQAHSPRWSTTLAPEAPGRGAPDDGELLQRAHEHFAATAGERPVEDVPALLAALYAECEREQWKDVLTLARAADSLLARSGRWGAWAAALRSARTAGEAIGDRAAVAWALHQLGTRAGCLGDPAGAAQLERALALRRELGDETGAAITAHNLALLFGVPPGGGQNGNGAPPPRDRPPARWLAIAAGGLVIGLVAVVLIASHGSSPKSASRVVAAPVTQTQTHGRTTSTVSGTPATRTPKVRLRTASGGRSRSGGTGHTVTPAPGPVVLIDGDLTFEVPAGQSETHRATVVNRGPGDLAAVEPSIDNREFGLDTAGCPQPLPAGHGCLLFITYRGLKPATGILRFKGSPSSAKVSGMLQPEPTEPQTTEPQTTEPQPVETTTTTGPG